MRDGLLPWRHVALIAALWSSQVNPTFAQDRGEWELHLTFVEPGVEPVTRFYGVMVSEAACHLAGQGLALLALQTGANVQIGVTCRRRVTA